MNPTGGDPGDLFVYGTLAPANPGDADRLGATADAVRGLLYDLGPYPALTALGDPAAGWVAGYVRRVGRAALDGPLDDYEGVAGGLYRRVVTTTRAGRRVWVYVYGKTLPKTARGPIERWEGRRVTPPSLRGFEPLE